MSIGTGAVLFVIGAILAFAVHVSVGFISLTTVGYILMAAGVVVFIVGLVLALRGRRTVTTSRTGVDAASGEPIAELLDVSRLTELDGMGERAVALVDRAVRNFVDGLSATLDALRTAVRTADAAEVRHLAHKLRGSALTLGVMRVAGIAQELEDLADLGSVEGGELLVDRLGTLGVPLLLDAPIGHQPANLPLPLGVRARLDVPESGQGRLSVPG